MSERAHLSRLFKSRKIASFHTAPFVASSSFKADHAGNSSQPRSAGRSNCEISNEWTNASDNVPTLGYNSHYFHVPVVLLCIA